MFMMRSIKCRNMRKANNKKGKNKRKRKNLNPEEVTYFPVINSKKIVNKDENLEGTPGPRVPFTLVVFSAHHITI